MLEPPHCEVFRKMLVHPEIVGRLREMCGAGFRLDSGPVFIGGIVGTPIHMLHGAGEPHKPSVSYDARNGTFFAGGVTVAYLLATRDPTMAGSPVYPGATSPVIPSRPDLDWLPSLKTHSDTFVQGSCTVPPHSLKPMGPRKSAGSSGLILIGSPH